MKNDVKIKVIIDPNYSYEYEFARIYRSYIGSYCVFVHNKIPKKNINGKEQFKDKNQFIESLMLSKQI